jgi:hypothetical protein
MEAIYSEVYRSGYVRRAGSQVAASGLYTKALTDVVVDQRRSQSEFAPGTILGGQGVQVRRLSWIEAAAVDPAAVSVSRLLDVGWSVEEEPIVS